MAESIDDLREQLARQILEAALKSDNAQFKVDAFKALEKYGMKGGKPAENPAGAGAMASFHERVKRAEMGIDGDGESPETDQ
jgi:restriction endonuclease Mrr